ncbi:Geranylgeranyl transferase type-1 subunit beta [Geodia barretti]|uniref:Geranylgeranyl transferase type-1 subunit beta n=1 Tax=Geodia barretti TaxID=519541 RepID=A0AA35QXQ8_GEOBA|nr:Geranylgeranyl transferase type-1 subunit beta [Geodia barretti]
MEEEEKEEVKLEVKKQIKFLQRSLSVLPYSARSLDVNRMTILFFSVCGLDILNSLDTALRPYEREQIIEWIYSQQVLPQHIAGPDACCGFRGGGYLGVPFDSTKHSMPVPCDTAHVAMTYTALAVLIMLGDDLSRINRSAISRSLRNLQREDGSFQSMPFCGENDMRFVYSASCVCHILDDWSGIDVEKAVQFIRRSQGYDYGIGQMPHLESHGGSTFCAVASLSLMGRLDSAFSPEERRGLARWCLRRQVTGFQGRPNKPSDTCYSFWIGASLELLGWFQYVNKEWNRGFLLSTRGKMVGGFAKWPESHPDPLHTCLGLAGLSLNGEPGLNSLDPHLTLTRRASEWMDTLHRKWRTQS